MDNIRIHVVAPHDFDAMETSLADIVADGGNGGPAISFMQPYSLDHGRRFWVGGGFPGVARGGRVLFVAYLDGAPVGTVQMDVTLRPNQPHRCEVAKMVVHSRARRRGVGRALMHVLESHAKSLDKKLIALDPRTGDKAEILYVSVGYQRA